MDGIARVLDLEVHVLHLRIGALEFDPLKLQLIPFPRNWDLLAHTSPYELSLTEQRQGNDEAGLQETADVLAIDAVDSVPLHVYQLRIATLQTVIG